VDSQADISVLAYRNRYSRPRAAARPVRAPAIGEWFEGSGCFSLAAKFCDVVESWILRGPWRFTPEYAIDAKARRYLDASSKE
jgi:hypothetical protein